MFKIQFINKSMMTAYVWAISPYVQNNMLSYMNLYLSSVCGPVIWLHLTLVLVLTPAPSTLPYGSNVQNNRWWISYWSVETLRPKTISVGAALVCRLWLWWFALGFDSSMKFAPTYHAEIRRSAFVVGFHSYL